MYQIKALEQYIAYCKKKISIYNKGGTQVYTWWYSKAIESCEKRINELKNAQ